MKRHLGLWILIACLLVARTLQAQTVTFVSPTSGATLTGSSTTISWTLSSDILECWLYVGATQGKADLYNSNSLGTAASCSVSGLPTDGRTLYIRLWYRSSAGWTYADHQCVASSTTQSSTSSVAITSPTSGSTLSGSTQTFSWSSSTSILQYWLYVGSTQGRGNLYNSNSLETATSCSVSGLPTDGRTVYARLWYRNSSGWNFVDSQYVASSTTQSSTSTVAMTSPTPGSTLTTSSLPFTWSQPTEVLENWLTVGSWKGRGDLFNSKSLGLATSCSVSGLPTDGRSLQVRLWYRRTSGWSYIDCEYKAMAITATMTSPTPGSTLTGSSTTFTWTQSDGILENWLTVGSRRSTHSYFNSNSLGVATSCTASGLPTQGQVLTVRLWYRAASGWAFKDYHYRAVVTPLSILGTEQKQ